MTVVNGMILALYGRAAAEMVTTARSGDSGGSLTYWVCVSLTEEG